MLLAFDTASPQVTVALHDGADTVVVLVGHNERVRARMQAAYADDGRVQVWGFTDRMVTLLAAADVLIHSTAGLTVLEALMCFRRAGADMILSYYAKQAAIWLAE